MATVIVMPKYGANMEEGTIASWLISEGDPVEKDQVIAEIAIEKLSNELAAPVSGTVLKLVAEEDETLLCGEPIAVIGQEGEDISELLAGDVSNEAVNDKTAEHKTENPKDKQAEPAGRSGTVSAGVTVVEMPRYGANMEEGTIGEWFVAEGDSVEKGQAMGEIAIEKLSNELEAPASGVVRKLLAEVDETLPCGAPIAVIADSMDADISGLSAGGADEQPQEDASGQSAPATKPAAEVATQAPRDDVSITPKALELAEAEGVNYRVIVGTGRHGAITRDDVRSFIASGATAEAPETAGQSAVAAADVSITPKALDLAEAEGIDYRTLSGTGRHGMITRDDIRRALADGTAVKATAPGKTGTGSYGTPEASSVKMTEMQKVIAKAMSRSLSDTAQTTISMDADVTELVKAYKAHKDAYKADGVKLSYTALLIKAVALALIEHKDLRTSMEGSQLVTKGEINIGVAIDVPGGLVVPNIKRAHEKDVRTIANELADLAVRAKEGRLESDEMTGGTFTITNLGMFGIKYFTPVLNLPESGILGVGTLVEQPTIVDGGIFVRQVMNLSLTHDHRVVNGAPAARFLNAVREILADAEALL